MTDEEGKVQNQLHGIWLHHHDNLLRTGHAEHRALREIVLRVSYAYYNALKAEREQL